MGFLVLCDVFCDCPIQASQLATLHAFVGWLVGIGEHTALDGLLSTGVCCISVP